MLESTSFRHICIIFEPVYCAVSRLFWSLSAKIIIQWSKCLCKTLSHILLWRLCLLLPVFPPPPFTILLPLKECPFLCKKLFYASCTPSSPGAKKYAWDSSKKQDKTQAYYTRTFIQCFFIDCAPWHCMHNLICDKMPQAGVEPARRSLDMGF